ncbi:hypothetical protein AAZV13_05G049000 [Glycine max]
MFISLATSNSFRFWFLLPYPLSLLHFSMAVVPYTTGSAPLLSPPSTSSVATKLYSGLKLQAASPFGAAKPNVTAEFYGKVHNTLHCRYANHNTSMARIRMMPIGTPKVPYRTPGEGTWQWVDVWNALYRERVIFIGQEIDEEFSNQILATMLYLDSIENSKKLYMYINGPGGDLTPSMAIYDTMQSLQSPVATHCVGYAYSLAAFLLAAGEKGNRSAMPLSRVALTSPAGAARGQITKDLSRMKRFNAQEALEYGLIDRIVRPPRIKADAPRKEAGTGLG